MDAYKTILITGASSGLGEGLAIAYAKPAVNLLLIGRDLERLAHVAKQCENKGATVISGTIDVQDREALSQWVLAQDDLTPIDLVIANAGVSNAGKAWTPEQSQRIFDINVFGVLNTIHPIIPRMQARGRGQIALMSSMSSFVSLSRAPAYCATKTAVRVYGEAMYGWLKKHNVIVSTICPGFVRTPLTAKNPYQMPALMDLEQAVIIIQKGLQRKKPLIIFPRRIYVVLWILNLLPFSWRSKITSKL